MKLIRYLVPVPKQVHELWGLLGYKDRVYQIECNPDEYLGSIGESMDSDDRGETPLIVSEIGNFTNSSTLYKEPNETI